MDEERICCETVVNFGGGGEILNAGQVYEVAGWNPGTSSKFCAGEVTELAGEESFVRCAAAISSLCCWLVDLADEVRRLT